MRKVFYKYAAAAHQQKRMTTKGDSENKMANTPTKATVTLSGKYYLSNNMGTEEFSGLRINIPEDKADKALSVCLGLLKRHLKMFLPMAIRVAKCKVDSIQSETLSRNGKPVDVMDLAELIYVIKDREMRINVNEFPSIQELRYVVKLYLDNEDEATAYIRANRVKYKEEQELMSLNPDIASRTNTYLDPAAIEEAKKVKVRKPQKNFNKVEHQDLDSDLPDTDPNTGEDLVDDTSSSMAVKEYENSEAHRQALLSKAIKLGLRHNPQTGIPKLQAMIEKYEGGGSGVVAATEDEF